MSIGTRLREALRTVPMRFQIRGVRFLEGRAGRALLGDDMGLGKTLQTIGWLALHPEVQPVLIVCPATVKFVWQQEYQKHMGLKCTILNGRKPYQPKGKRWIINYEILSHWTPFLKGLGIQALVIDECHRIKNRKAQRTKACTKLAMHIPHTIGLSGTPVVNRPVEFFPILNILAPQTFSSFWRYAFQYCDPKPGFQGRGWDFTGASNLDELHRLVSIVMIRRTKTEVLKDLPPKTKTIMPVGISNAKIYTEAMEDFLTWLQKERGAGAALRALRALAFVRLGTLKRLAGEGKVEIAIDWITNWLEETDEKLVVFGVHRSVLASLKEHFPKAAFINGTIPPHQREQEIEKFQTDNQCRLFIGSIRAAGIGTTLHAASTVLFTELEWTPAEHEQAEDRVLRIGQKASHVNIYYLIANGTIEEEILDLLDHKRDVCSRILDGSKGSVQAILLNKFLKTLKKEKK